jgi:hypothetical protein
MKIVDYYRDRVKCDIKIIQRIRSDFGLAYKSLKEKITRSGISAAIFEAYFIFFFLDSSDNPDSSDNRFIFTLMHGSMALEAYSEQHPQ